VDTILTRTRDVDPLVRKLVYASVFQPRLEHPRFLSIAQRKQLVQTGLGDREPAVRLAAGKMVAAWLELVLADPVRAEDAVAWTADDGGIMIGGGRQAGPRASDKRANKQRDMWATANLNSGRTSARLVGGRATDSWRRERRAAGDGLLDKRAGGALQDKRSDEATVLFYMYNILMYFSTGPPQYCTHTALLTSIARFSSVIYSRVPVRLVYY
jgi:hypothetical protein